MIPVVYVHKGNHAYVREVIKQAVERCGVDQVYLIGDRENEAFCENWTWMDLYKSSQFEEFVSLYFHRSYTSEEYELFCFQRYFLLYEFMKAKGVREAFLCDSDLLIYENLSGMDFHDYEAACSCCRYPVYFGECASPHCSYWRLERLEDFISYLMDVYRNRRELVEEVYRYHQDHHVLWVSAICDMVWLTAWKQARVKEGMRFLNMNEGMFVHGKLIVWEHNLSVADNARQGEYRYAKTLHMKIIRFYEENPYLVQKDGNRVQAATLHCQGAKKKYIPLLCRQSNHYPMYLLVNLWDVFYRKLRERKR